MLLRRGIDGGGIGVWGGSDNSTGMHDQDNLRREWRDIDLHECMPMKQLDRKTVYEVIDTERTHQERKWGTVEQHPHEVGAWLTIMRNILTQAEAAWSGKDGDHYALEEVRKLAATAVACGEQHGLRPRWHSELKERMRK